MEVKRMENFLDNIGWLGCKWTNSNAPGMKFHLCDPILKLGDSPIIGPLGYKEMAPQYEGKKDGKISEQNGLQMD